MAILRPNQLPSASTPLSVTDLVVVDQGAGGVNAADPQDVVDAAAPVVSQANAEAGLNNNDRMTALRTKQSIASEVGVTIASAAQGILASTAVQPSRQVIAGSGLTGGGALSADVTLNVGAGTGISVAGDTVGLDATAQSRLLIGGGTTSQVLQKSSNTDYDVAWATVAAATAVSYAPQTLTSGEQIQARTNIGLGNVDNTSDANKPVSTATQTALNLKANLASPPLTGTPTAPTASAGTSTTQIATTAFVANALNGVRFSANKNGTDQTGLGTTPTKLTFTTEVEDVGGYYDAANSRFTPLVAGTYQVNCVLFVAGTVSDGALYRVYIYKNGSLFFQAAQRASGATSVFPSINKQVPMNGSTDYIEIFYQHAAAGGTVSGGVESSVFEAFLL
jgi:hypothetical protein